MRTGSFRNWPEGTSPAEVGKRVAENFVARKFEYTQISPQTGERKREFVIYPEACAWKGSLTVAKLTGDKDLTEKLVRKFDPLLGPDASFIPSPDHVDKCVIGIVPFQICMEEKSSDYLFGFIPLSVFHKSSARQYLAIGKNLADKQWANPTADGITNQARYWVDDMYMITAVQTQAYRATGDKKYLDRAALTMAAYLDKLQQPNGLFFHAADSPFFWSRGNGWFAAGMAELLSELPKSNPHRDRIMKGYQAMMASLLKYQAPDGMWRQLIDKPEAWEETSGTGMFAFAMVTGVKNGWLDADTYGPAARKAWLGLAGQLDDKNNVKNVCIGTNKAFREVGADPAEQLQYYLDRGRKTGDLHGQAPILWTASALLR
jgi:rhamnogalacturonyl hydrolase YesR